MNKGFNSLGRKSEKAANSALTQAADALRAYAMSRGDGEFLGSEEEMIERFGVSRPTFRQACAQVVQENLIAVRRGVGGGYFARVPTSMSVSRIAALYLQSRTAGLEEIIHAMKPIRVEIAVLAARNRDPEALERLRSFLAAEEETDKAGDHSYREFLRTERAFGRLIGEMSGNSVLTLFLNILYDFTAVMRRDEDVLLNRPTRVETYRELRLRMARAILDGDEDYAIVSTRRCSDVVSDWMREDFGGRSFNSVAEPEASEASEAGAVGL